MQKKIDVHMIFELQNPELGDSRSMIGSGKYVLSD
jgi:hypothetical protein